MNRTQLLTIASLMVATTAMPAQAWIIGNGTGDNGCEANAVSMNGKDVNGKDVNGISRNGVETSGVTLLAIEMPRDAE